MPSQVTFTCLKLTMETLKKCEMYSKLTMFIVNFEHISNLFSIVSIVDFEQVNIS